VIFHQILQVRIHAQRSTRGRRADGTKFSGSSVKTGYRSHPFIGSGTLFYKKDMARLGGVIQPRLYRTLIGTGARCPLLGPLTDMPIALINVRFWG
jgi:hypothetical protein